MKRRYLFIFFLISTLSLFSQPSSFQHVDSLIRYELKYVYDSTTDQIPQLTKNWNKTKSLHPSHSSLPSNPSPLIILNGRVVNKMDTLKTIRFKSVNEILVMKGDDPIKVALYGSGKNGVLLITT